MGDTAFLAENLPFALFAGLLGAGSLLWWGFLRPQVLVWLLAATLVAGQLIRLPLPGQGGGLLLSDIIAFILVVVLCLRPRTWSMKPEIVSLVTAISLFIAWAGYRLWLEIGIHLSTDEFLIAGAYLGRLGVYLLLMPLLMHAASHNARIRSAVQSSFLAAVLLISMGGIVQYIFFPNVAAFNLAGWDPHQHRLVATWLDPNLVGLLFVIATPFFGYKFIQTKQYWYAFSTALVLISLVLTASRSSFIAAAGSFLLALGVSALTLRRPLSTHIRVALSATCLTLFISIIVLLFLFPQRFTGLITSDATVNLRAQALTQSVRYIVEPHALTGVGYNAYQFAAQDAGLISDFFIHSRSGADNSLLTLWATTGVIGIFLVGLIATLLWRIILTKQRHYFLPFWVFFTAITAILIHSQFINSALYAHVLISAVFIIALTYSSTTAYGH